MACAKSLRSGETVSCFLSCLTHSIHVDTSTDICWISPCVILRMTGLFCRLYSIFDGRQCNPDQTPHYVHCLQCLPLTLLRISR